MRISDICKERRTALKLTNSVISEQSGINLQTVNNFFSQKSMSPSIYTAGPICRVLGVSLDEVFEIIAPGMGEEEINRIKKQSEYNQEELLRYQKEIETQKKESEQQREIHLHTIQLQEQQLIHNKEIIRRQDARIKSQVKAIFWLRCLIGMFAALLIVFIIV